jgi:hypothetical protein
VSKPRRKGGWQFTNEEAAVIRGFLIARHREMEAGRIKFAGMKRLTTEEWVTRSFAYYDHACGCIQQQLSRLLQTQYHDKLTGGPKPEQSS